MVNYDAQTEKSGIPYISALYSANFEYKTIVTWLDNNYASYTGESGSSGSVQSYSIGSRSLTRATFSATDLSAEWDVKMRRKLQLERGTKPRRAVGVVLRDW
ncbi:MAG: hypothetical protein K5894_08390 [Lachnospiraceae bacterium]|nr:hypothetical protein [Lachnospiraceae bacterium]